MASVARWNPFREMDEVARQLEKFMGTPARTGGRESLAVADWAPAVEVSETDNEYLIKAEIPEVDKKDVKVTVQEGVLTIQGERRREREEKGRTFHRVERAYGTFARSFALPEDVEDEKLKAEFKDGMLHVHLPKSEKSRPRSIEVKVE